MMLLRMHTFTPLNAPSSQQPHLPENTNSSNNQEKKPTKPNINTDKAQASEQMNFISVQTEQSNTNTVKQTQTDWYNILNKLNLHGLALTISENSQMQMID